MASTSRKRNPSPRSTGNVSEMASKRSLTPARPAPRTDTAGTSQPRDTEPRIDAFCRLVAGIGEEKAKLASDTQRLFAYRPNERSRVALASLHQRGEHSRHPHATGRLAAKHRHRYRFIVAPQVQLLLPHRQFDVLAPMPRRLAKRR